MDQLDARDVFGRHDRGLAETLIRDHAGEMDDSIPHGDAELHGLPVILLNRCDYAAANVVIIGGRIRNVSRETCDGAKQVGTCHNPDQRHLRAPRANA